MALSCTQSDIPLQTQICSIIQDSQISQNLNKRTITCDPGDPNGIVRGGESEGNLLGLEAFDAAENSGIGVRQVDGVTAEAEVEGDGDGAERAVEGGGDRGMGGAGEGEGEEEERGGEGGKGRESHWDDALGNGKGK